MNSKYDESLSLYGGQNGEGLQKTVALLAQLRPIFFLKHSILFVNAKNLAIR